MAHDANNALGKEPGIVRLSGARRDRRAPLHGYAGNRTRSGAPGGPETRGITGCCIRSKSSRFEAHPFRDGNGRTQRALWDQLAAAAGHTIHWQAIPNDVNIRISHEARVNNNLDPLRSTLRAIVTDDGLMARTVKSHEASRLAAMDTPTRPGAGSAGTSANPAPSAGYRAPGLDAGRGYGR